MKFIVNMWARTILGSCGVLVACGGGSGDADSGAHSSGGAAGTDGGSDPGGARASNSGSTQLSGGMAITGGVMMSRGGSTADSTQASGGTGIGGVGKEDRTGGGGGLNGVGTGGYGSAGTGNSGNPETSNCPQWPQSRLRPYVGVFFFGPDPGPCSSVHTTSAGSVSSTFNYVGSQISTIVSASQTLTYNWASGLPTDYTLSAASGGKATGQYGWSTTSVSESISIGTTTRIDLGPNGYPIDFWTTNSTASYMLYRYEYSDCRLVRRVAYSSSGAPDSGITMAYDYDDKGHIVAERMGNGVTTAYDYSCW